MSYKLLVLDVDGTLVGRGSHASPGVTEAITKAKEKGVAVALGTGRASEACYHLLKQLHLDKLHIFFDGAAVVDWPSNDIIFLQALPPRAAKRLIELAREYDLFLEIYAHDFYFIERDGCLAERQREKLKIDPLMTDLMTLVGRIKIVKGQVLATNHDEKLRAEELSQKMAPYCKMSWSFDRSNNTYFINAVARSVSKGESLRNVVDYLGIDLSQVIAIGDSFNDLPVFQIAGLSIAMGNASDSLKELADWVAPSVENDGVAVAIEKFIL